MPQGKDGNFKATGSPLTIKRKNFVKELIKNKGNQADAYIAAGYTAKNKEVASVGGSQLISDPNVKQELEQQLESAGLSKVEVFESLKTSIKSGEGVKSTNADSLRGINMLLKLYDLYPVQRKQVTKLDVTLDLSGKTPEELKQLLDASYKDAKEYIEGEIVEPTKQQ